MQPAVFLDRDGVIIENREDYIKSWSDVRFLPEALATLSRLSQTAHALVLVTNQSAIGRGIITMGQAVEINRRVIAEIVSWGGRIDAWYICPHHPEEGCDCRKPMPGMLRQAEREVGVDLSRSFLIGDAVSDIQAARAVGTRGILVLTGRGQEQLSILEAQGSADCPVVANLQAAVDYIMEYGK